MPGPQLTRDEERLKTEIAVRSGLLITPATLHLTPPLLPGTQPSLGQKLAEQTLPQPTSHQPPFSFTPAPAVCPRMGGVRGQD